MGSKKHKKHKSERREKYEGKFQQINVSTSTKVNRINLTVSRHLKT